MRRGVNTEVKLLKPPEGPLPLLHVLIWRNWARIRWKWACGEEVRQRQATWWWWWWWRRRWRWRWRRWRRWWWWWWRRNWKGEGIRGRRGFNAHSTFGWWCAANRRCRNSCTWQTPSWWCAPTNSRASTGCWCRIEQTRTHKKTRTRWRFGWSNQICEV